ncbi:LacI family DNA-binding transcriptional regulator [Jannaschia sp. LMIT008]|uniref:LacI family DNA-binding transcriptional regulator n=1 Tax=Jannaschia maritima TaxID=3032585 RepID=UPI0028116AF7|nr:LacI family DNA-binding transcriptional regulator [Jannaschia sp. LMIT008]
MGRSRITARDVAAAAGVSQPTVSRVFADNARVDPATRDRVMRAAGDLGYRPNRLARAMSRGRSHTVGLIVAGLDNPFYADAVDRFSRALQARGYHAVIVTASNDAADLDGQVRDILAMQVDGLILASVSIDNALARAASQAGVPLVLFNRGQHGTDLPTVTSANHDGGRRAAHLLVDRGHRRIAHVSGWQGSATGVDRQRGFLDGMADRGVAPLACIDSRYDRDRARRAVHDLFGADVTPDAIFAGNDLIAFAVLSALRHDLGLSVPRDVSVLGYDDVAMAAWPEFDLTTFRQPAGRMVDATIGMLMDLIDGRPVPDRLTEIRSDLIERGSVRAAP